MLWNALRVAFRELRRNVLRSVLTVLGIVIGVAAVITMVTLGTGATVQVQTQIRSLGSNMLIVSPGRRVGAGPRLSAPPFDLADAEAIAAQVRAVRAVAPQSPAAATAVYGSENWSTVVTGVTDGFFAVRDWPVVQGRRFFESELRAGAAVCLIGATVHHQLFGRADPVDERIRLGKLACKVVGLLEPKGQSAMGQDQDNLVLVPLRAYQRRVAGNTDIAMIQVSIRNGQSTDKAKRDIEYLMRERRRIGAGEDDDFSVTDMKEIAQTVAGTTQVLTMLFGAVAAVSLVVGGIGIMNIMLVSVAERTREIGIRLAIGALEREVLTQFLVEAAALSSFGGILGIAVATVASLLLADLLQVPFIFDPGIAAVAFLFSAAVGIVFGYLPARRAARLDPIEALRHE